MTKLCALVWAALLVGVCGASFGQSVKVMMLSDLHFDPLRDAAKAERLAAAPVEKWDEILKEPDSATQAADFAALQSECNVRGEDPGYVLLTASLNAAKAQAGGAAFVTITGDLLVHGIDCRYNKLLKGKDKAGSAAFAEKSAVWVMKSVEAAFPSIPVYFAGGNHDTSCGDYQLNLSDRYLVATRPVAMEGLHHASAARQAAEEYGKDGSFAVMVPGLSKTRLLVFDDLYLAESYKDCAGHENASAGRAALAWLERELSEVKAKGEQAWVIGHIPPGVNVYSTLAKGGDLCAGDKVKLLLSSDGLAATLVKHSDVVRLAVFAHTHFDEVRLLGGKVPMKLVPSVSPINGNRPTFTVAQVDAKTATLENYSVYEASNETGVDASWPKAYSYRETYGEKDFSGASVADLVGLLQADGTGLRGLSRKYEENFAPGMLPVLGLVWPKYACALSNTTEESYKSCACGTN